MNSLVPRGYGSFPTVQFGFPDQSANAYGNGGYARQGAFFAPRYSGAGYHPPLFNRMNKYPHMGVNQFQQSSIGEQLISAFNDLDRQYRYEQYLNQVKSMQNKYWKGHANGMPLPAAGLPITSLTTDPGEVYNVIRETRYVPYPIAINQGGGNFSGTSGLGYGTEPNFGFGVGGGMNLTPKVRVIFIPTGQSFLQQSCAGPLTMPPFLYNRISQPFYSFPLPPPLPQIGSLPLTPNVQQMVMQRYSNPVAVLPFTPNWQMPQMMMSGWPQIPQQQQQQQCVDPVSAFQPYQSAPQPYFCPQMPAVPSYPPESQYYIPPPSVLAPPSFPSAPQSYLPHPVPAAPSYPPAPQSYIPPPPNIPTSSCMPPPPSYQLPYANAHAIASAPQYLNSGYPGICRACPPAPPSLNVPVTGHCWVQHCAACHHIPTPISNPNTRPTGGRITPLLRHPIVPQYIPDQTSQQQEQQYYHANAPVMMRPWLRKTPPLPPGAVLLSDEYFDRNGSRTRYDHSQRKQRKYSRSSGDRRRSKIVESYTTSTTSLSSVKHSKKTSNNRPKQNNSKPIQQQGPLKSKDPTSLPQLSTSSSDLSTEYQKMVIQKPNAKKGNIPPQVANEARNVNLEYNYRPQELSSVYLINRFLKSSGDTISLSSNRETAINRSPSLDKTRSQTSLSSSDLSSIREESNIEFDHQQSAAPSSSSGKPKEKLIIIREFMTNSPSTLSTISSNMTFSVIGKDSDSISTTSTIQANRLDEDDVLESEIS